MCIVAELFKNPVLLDTLECLLMVHVDPFFGLFLSSFVHYCDLIFHERCLVSFRLLGKLELRRLCETAPIAISLNDMVRILFVVRSHFAP